MSLINDALKRASQSEKNRPRAAGLPAAMQPTPERRRSNVPMLIGVWVFVSLAVAAWFFWPSASRRGNSAPPPAASSTSDGRATLPRSQGAAPTPSDDPTNAPGSAGASPYRAAPPPAAASTNVSGGAAAPSNQASAPTTPVFPELKLQGIFYSPSNPRAAINGQIKGENEKIGDVRIVTITQKKVTVQWNGRTQDLILEGD